MVSSLYGPLGISAPFSLQAKMLLQELCSKNLGWDEIIPHPLSEQWSNWLKHLQKVSAEFKVDRCITVFLSC